MLNGWISLDRVMLDHWVSSEPELLAFWVRLLMEANFETKKRMFNGVLVEIKRGQCVFGLDAFAAKSGISPKKLRRYLSMLESEGMIGRQKTNKFSLISITNYDSYQREGRQRAGKGQAKGNQEAGKGQHRNKVNNGNNENKEILPAPDKPDAAHHIGKAKAIQVMDLFNETKQRTGANWLKISDPAMTSDIRYKAAIGRAKYVQKRLEHQGKTSDWPAVLEWFGKLYDAWSADPFYSGHQASAKYPEGYKRSFESLHAEKAFIEALDRMVDQ